MAVDVYTFSILGRIANQPCANVLHFKSAQTAAANPLDAAQQLLTAFTAVAGPETLYLACLPDNYELQGYKIRRFNNGGSPTFSQAATGAGTRAGAADLSGPSPVGLFHANAGVGAIPWRTGKIFFPGVSIDDVADNIFVVALRNAILAFMDAILAGIGAGPAGPFVVTVLDRILASIADPIAASVSLKVGTQRRRYVPI